MIKWKIKFFIFILFKFSQFIICENDSGKQNDVKTYKDYYDNSLELEKVQIKYINYKKINAFTFKGINVKKSNDLLVNFHSIDCDINIIYINNDSKDNVHIIEVNIISLLFNKISLDNNENL